MSRTTPLRERVLHLVREERTRQISMYGDNRDLPIGFGGSVTAYPWLEPFSNSDAAEIESDFREDYEMYKSVHGKPTWMHLVREEVAELFKAQDRDNAIEEAVQVAALCVSLVEHLIENEGVLP